MTFEPLKAKNVDLILGDELTGTNFKCQLRSVQLTPDTNIERIRTLCPTGQFASVSDPEWSLELGYLYGKDEDNPTEALARYLFDNTGQQVPFAFRPWSGDDSEGYKGTVTLIPGPIGGEEGSFSEQSVSLPVEGQPEPLTASTGGGGGTTATGATSGTPGTWTPSGAVAPSSTAGITATPATAWATGEHVILSDSSHTYWDGAAWQTGEAP